MNPGHNAKMRLFGFFKFHLVGRESGYSNVLVPSSDRLRGWGYGRSWEPETASHKAAI